MTRMIIQVVTVNNRMTITTLLLSVTSQKQFVLEKDKYLKQLH